MGFPHVAPWRRARPRHPGVHCVKDVRPLAAAQPPLCGPHGGVSSSAGGAWADTPASLQLQAFARPAFGVPQPDGAASRGTPASPPPPPFKIDRVGYSGLDPVMNFSHTRDSAEEE